MSQVNGNTVAAELSSDSDEECATVEEKRRPGIGLPQVMSRRISNRVRATPRIRRNVRGENPLHLACIQGSYAHAATLVNMQRVLINDKDFYGWTPLHEAANHGHYDIMKLLLENGANVDARSKDGVTALMDTISCNGNIECAKLLLQHKARVTLEDERHLDAVAFLDEFVLREMKERGSKLSPDEQVQVDLLRAQMLGMMAAERFQRSQASKDMERDLQTYDVGGASVKHAQLQARSPRRRAQKCRTQSQQSEGSAVDYVDGEATRTYQHAMNAIGSKSGKVHAGQSRVESGSRTGGAFVDEESYEVGNDWLIDDLAPMRKKRKRRSGTKTVPSSRSAVCQQRCNRDQENANDSTADLFSDTTGDIGLGRMCRQLPTAPLAPHVEPVSDLFDTELVAVPSSSSSVHVACTDRDAERLSPRPVLHTRPQTSSTAQRVATYMNVLLDTVKYRIPLNSNQRIKVSEFAIACASRFKKDAPKTYVVRLSTADGAQLADDDVLLDVVGLDETLVADIVGSRAKPLEQAYRDACAQSGGVCYHNVIGALGAAERTSELRLAAMGLKPANFGPVLQALRAPYRLSVVELSSSRMNEEVCAELGGALSELDSVKVVRLRNCAVSTLGLDALVRALVKNLMALEELDIGFNLLDDLCVPPFVTFKHKCPKLTALNVRGNRLGESVLEQLRALFDNVISIYNSHY